MMLLSPGLGAISHGYGLGAISHGYGLGALVHGYGLGFAGETWQKVALAGATVGLGYLVLKKTKYGRKAVRTLKGSFGLGRARARRRR